MTGNSATIASSRPGVPRLLALVTGLQAVLTVLLAAGCSCSPEQKSASVVAAINKGSEVNVVVNGQKVAVGALLAQSCPEVLPVFDKYLFAQAAAIAALGRLATMDNSVLHQEVEKVSSTCFFWRFEETGKGELTAYPAGLLQILGKRVFFRCRVATESTYDSGYDVDFYSEVESFVPKAVMSHRGVEHFNRLPSGRRG